MTTNTSARVTAPGSSDCRYSNQIDTKKAQIDTTNMARDFTDELIAGFGWIVVGFCCGIMMAPVLRPFDHASQMVTAIVAPVVAIVTQLSCVMIRTLRIRRQQHS